MDQTSCGPLKIGCWVDDPPRLVLKPGYTRDLKALPLEHLAVMLDGPKRGLGDRKWSDDDLKRLADAFPEHRRILVAWAVPHKDLIEELADKLPSAVEALSAEEVEFDVEGFSGWKSAHVRGYRSLAKAGEAIVAAAREASPKVSCDYFPQMGKAAHAVAEHCDEIALQLYAVARRNDKPIPWGSRLGPVRYPEGSLKRERERFPDKPLIAGLAAYKQTWVSPRRPPEEAMRESIASAVRGGTNTIRYWGGKHLVRMRGTAYARRFLMGLGEVAKVAEVAA